MALYPSLIHRPVLVTGGAAGIGAAVVEAFAEQAAAVAFIDRDASAAADLAARVTGSLGVAPFYEICDLSDIEACRGAVARLAEQTGAFRVLVNNGGSDEAHGFQSVTPDYFDDRIAVNLRHQFFLAQMVAPSMAIAGGGSIINLGSISRMIGAGDVPVHAAAQAAVEGLTRSLARELGPDRIRVNSIAPGWVLTDRQLAKGAKDSGKFDAYLDRQSIKEYLQPHDVAEMALWLAADESKCCTAHTWFVDGGATA